MCCYTVLYLELFSFFFLSLSFFFFFFLHWHRRNVIKFIIERQTNLNVWHRRSVIKFIIECRTSLNAGVCVCNRCPSYPAMPKYCTLNPIPGMCCASLFCDVPNVGNYQPYPQLEPNPKPTPGPDGMFPTPQPTLDPQLILGTGVGNLIGGTGLPGGGRPVPGGFLHNLGGITGQFSFPFSVDLKWRRAVLDLDLDWIHWHSQWQDLFWHWHSQWQDLFWHIASTE